MKKKFSGLEIICLGRGKTKTGADCKILMNGEEVQGKWAVSSFTLDINPDKSIIKINHFHDLKTGERFGIVNEGTDNEMLIEKTLRISYPIKRIELDYKWLSVLSDNTPIGTKFFINGEDITKHSGVVEFHTYIGNADEIVEYKLVGC